MKMLLVVLVVLVVIVVASGCGRGGDLEPAMGDLIGGKA
jgi:predicted small lipoprotein YifL